MSDLYIRTFVMKNEFGRKRVHLQVDPYETTSGVGTEIRLHEADRLKLYRELSQYMETDLCAVYEAKFGPIPDDLRKEVTDFVALLRDPQLCFERAKSKEEAWMAPPPKRAAS